jgi:hypothetical protein
LKIARRFFNAGLDAKKHQVPKGRPKDCQPSLRASTGWRNIPALKRRAIFKHPFGIHIQAVPDLKFVAQTAAAKLQGADYYRWVFANEPEWQEFQ